MRDVTNYFSRPFAIMEKVRDVPILTGVRDVTNLTEARDVTNYPILLYVQSIIGIYKKSTFFLDYKLTLEKA